MVHVYVDAKNFKWYLEDKLFEAHTKDLKKPGDIHISIPREWILQHFPTEDGVLFVVDPKKKRLEIDFSPLLGEIYIIYQDNVNRYHPSEFGLTTDDLINMSTEELKKHIEKKWREMKDIDLTKGSGALYGEGELLGKIKRENDGHTIVKSESDEDELEKGEGR